MGEPMKLELGLFGTATLGALIDALERRPQDSEVRFAFGYFAPKGLGSYRGFYEHLAIGYDADAPMRTVADFLSDLRDAVGRMYEGYKGGEYCMSRDTPIWVAGYGESTSTAVVGVAGNEWLTVIETGWSGV